MINKENLKKLADLSKLDISDETLKSYTDDIRALLLFADINSKMLGVHSKNFVSIHNLRCGESISLTEINPQDITPYSKDGFYTVGEENSHDK